MNVEQRDDTDLPVADLMGRLQEITSVFNRYKMPLGNFLVCPFPKIIGVRAEYSSDVDIVTTEQTAVSAN